MRSTAAQVPSVKELFWKNVSKRTMDVTKPLARKVSSRSISFDASHLQASDNESCSQPDLQSRSGMQTPHNPYRYNEHDDIRQHIRYATISKQRLLVDAMCASYLWIPISCKRPTGSKSRNSCRYCQTDEDSRSHLDY